MEEEIKKSALKHVLHRVWHGWAGLHNILLSFGMYEFLDNVWKTVERILLMK